MSELFKLVGTIAIDVTDATEKIEAVITAGDDLEKKLIGIGTNAESSIGSKSGFSAASVWLGNMLTELTQKAEQLGKQLWNTGFNMNLNEESWIASFKTYLGGDLEAATAMVEKLKQFAIDTPLTMQEVMAQATQLLATGTAPEKLIETLTMLGDVSRGDMSYFSRISTAYWQIMTTGRLLAQDANQLTQAGVPVWQLVADYFNMIERDGRTDWTKGLTKDLATQAALKKNPDLAISSEELYGALLFSTSENGMYFNAMNNAMDTARGKLQKLQDAFTQFAASLTQPFTDTMSAETFDKLTASFDNFTAWAEENPDVLKSLAQALSDVATNGLNVFLDGLKNLLTYWNENRALFDTMLMVLGGFVVSKGHTKAGLALLSAGGLDAYGYAKDELENGSPVGQQMMNESPEIAEAVKKGKTGELGFKDWVTYNVGAPLLQFLHNLFPSLTVEPDDPSVYGLPSNSGTFTTRDEVNLGENSGSGGGGSGKPGIPGLIAAVQALTAENQSAPEKVANAITAGLSGVSFTTNVNTGDVLLDGASVGRQVAPYVNTILGGMQSISNRG